MTFIEAKKKMTEGKRVRRETWYEAAWIELDKTNPDYGIKFSDESGRPHHVSRFDSISHDWVITEGNY